MENIKVRRYQEPNSYAASVEPEGREWILFIPRVGIPQLWVQYEDTSADGTTFTAYRAHEGAVIVRAAEDDIEGRRS